MSVIKIGITGSSGFIGKHLVASLKDKKNARLSCFDLPQNNILNFDSVKKFVVGQDVIVHIAAVNRGGDWEVIAGSVVATHNLVRAIQESGKKTKLIFTSSSQAETDTLYGLSKRLAEIMLRDFSMRYGIPVSIFRLTNVFGEGCKPFYNSVVATFCHQVANGQRLSVTNPGRKITFIYVKDVVKAVAREVFIKRKQPFYFKNLTSKNTITVRGLARLIQSFKIIKDSKKLKLKFYKDLYNTYFYATKIRN